MYLAPLGLTDCLLDDGYEPHWGAWFAKPQFGAALQTLNTEQSASGLKPALWIEPFYVDIADDAVVTYPDWFVHKRDGSLRTFSNLGSSMYAALDVSVPEAQVLIVDQLRTLRTWGYTTFKLDFLSGAAIEGVRREPMTGLQSYARFMQVLRNAVPDAHFVGCGAPLLPGVGWVDSMRTGADIAFTIAPDPRFSLITSEARSTAMRAFTDAWWALDPDVLLLRGTRITDAEAWTATLTAALAGGNYLVGDARQATDLRAAMALDPNVLALTRDGIAARPLDLMDGIEPALAPSPLLLRSSETVVPHVWQKSVGGTAHWVAVFGWQSDPALVIDLDLPQGAVEVVAPTTAGPAQ